MSINTLPRIQHEALLNPVPRSYNEKQLKGNMLEIIVCEIKGICPVYKVGDRMVIDGARILLDKTDAVCVHALSTLLHYVVALDEGADPVKLGLSKDSEHAYMQCVDPGQPYTDGGTVVFQCRRVEGELDK